ncbi:hypothetical protein ACQ4LE_005519 [Meloidogyne hapla]
MEIADALTKKLANTWKSKREKLFDIDAYFDMETRNDKIIKEIRGLLNKITPSSYQELSDEFCEYKIIEDPKLFPQIVDLIFDKVVEEPYFSTLYCDLCKKQVDLERQMLLQSEKTLGKWWDQADNQTEKPKENKTFRAEVLVKCQYAFLNFDDYYKKVKEFEEKLKDAEETRLAIKEELETFSLKQKCHFLGIVKFIGQLYRHQLTNEAIIDWCAVELVRRFETTQEEVYIEYTVELIKIVGKIYEIRKKLQQQRTSIIQIYPGIKIVVNGKHEKKEEQFRLDNVISHLSQLKYKVANRARFLIMDLEDLKKNRWLPRGEKGLKQLNR